MLFEENEYSEPSLIVLFESADFLQINIFIIFLSFGIFPLVYD